MAESKLCGRRKRVASGGAGSHHICFLVIRHKGFCKCSCGAKFVPTLRADRRVFTLKVYGLQESRNG